MTWYYIHDIYKKFFATIEKSELVTGLNKLNSRINRLYHKNLVTNIWNMMCIRI